MAKKKTVLENLRRLDEDREKEAEKQEEKKENRVIVNSYSPSSSSLSGAVNTKADQTKERERIILPTSSSSVLPTGSSNIARAQSRVSTPPQNDAGFLEYSIRNRNYQRPETQSGADYNALHEAWAKKTAAQQAIEETKKNGSNVTWNQALGRAANRAAQAAVTGVGNLGTAVRSTFGLPEYKSHQPVLDYLQNTEAGRQNAELSRLNAQSAEAENAYNTAMAASTARRAMSSGDFSAYSRYDPNKGNDKEFDKTYETVNRSRRYQTEALSQAMGANRGIDPNLAQLTSEEQAVYNYLYNKGDKASADNYLKSLYSELEKRGYTARETNLKEYAAENPVAASIVSPMLGSVSGIAAIPGTIETLRTGRVNPYASYNSVSQAGQTLVNTVAEKIAEPGTFSAKAASWIYQVGESVLENFLRTKMFGGLGANIGAAAGFDTEGIKSAAKVASLSPMLLSVFQSTANNAKLNGRTDEEAKTLAAIAAGAEWITESKSFEHLFDTYVKALEGKGSIGDWLGQISTEALEEGGSNIINNVADVMILGDQSEWARLVKKYQEEDHLSAADAKKKAFIAKAIDLGLDALGGAISGGALGGDALLAGVTKASVDLAAKSQENTKANRLMKAQNKIEESMQKKAQVEAEVKAAQGQTAEQWEQSRRDQSEGAKKRRAAIRDTGTKYNVAEDTIRSLEAVSDVTGADITILDAQGMKDRFNVKAEGNQIIPGFRVTKTGEIVINSDTDTDTAIKEVLGHELAHSLEGNKLWNDLRDAAWEYYSALADEETISREKEDFKARLEGKKTADFDFDSELTADFAGNVLLDSTSDIEKLVNSRHGLAQQIWNKLNEWLTRNTDDLDLRTKALLTSAREKYGRALQQNAAAAASANTTPSTTNTTVSTTAPTTQAVAPARGTLPTAAENMAAKEMTPYQQAVAELDRRMQAGEFEDDPDEYVEERDRLREEYGISPEDDIHEDRQRLGLEDENGEIKYKVVSTTDGREVAIIEDDILDGVPREEWGKTVEKYLINRFRNTGFDIGNLHVQVFPKGTGEYTRNRRTSMMYNNNSPYLKPKFQAAANIDEIGNVGRYWYNEPLTHPRKDDITEFRKAYSLFMIGDKKLGGIFVLAHKKDNTWMLYDLNSIRPEYFNIKKSELSVNREAANLQEKRSFTEGNSDTNNISQTSPEINSENNNNSKQSVTADNREAEPAAVSSDGETLTEELPGGTMVKYSVKSWNNTDKSAVKKNLVDAGYSETEADRYIENVNSIAAIIAGDPDRLDYDAADNQVYLKPNQDYVVTLDASTLCAKRLIYQGTLNKIMHKLGNRVLMPEDLIELSNMMAENNYQTPCGICYVESRRRHLSRFASEWLNNYKGSYKPTLDQLTTTDGLEELRKNHNDVYTAFIKAMNAKGSANPKVVQLRTDYRGDLNRLTPAQIKKILNIGGLRIQSFSDFETPHLIDTMQAVLDMSAKKLTAQAYTKVPNFAWVFGDTGIKINLSLIGDIDENGNLTFSSVEGMDFDEAMKLRNRYSKNVGTILVGKNDAHIIAAMGDDRIDFIIPFHKSGWSQKEIELMKALLGFEDYTEYQSERRVVGRYKNGKYMTESIEDQYYPIDYWDYNLSGKENAEKYLQMCAEDGRLPKFWNFLVDNGDGSFSLPQGNDKRSTAIRNGYWKTLIDFKMYDNDGKGAPQRAVTPNINMEEAKRVLADYEGGANELPSASDEFIDKYVEHYNSTHESDVQFKVTAAEDDEYMKAVKDGDEDTQRRIIDQAADSWAGGKAIRAYHGTDIRRNEFDTNRGNGTTQYGPGSYFTDGRYYAETWADERAGGSGKGYVGEYYIRPGAMFIDDDVDTDTEQWRNVENILRDYGVKERDIRIASKWGFRGIAMALQSVGMINGGRYAADDWNNAPLVNDILRQAGYNGIEGEFYDGRQYVIFDPAQIKSAELVTYDDNGNIIKPSERFDPKKNDIRYSIKAGPLDNASRSEYNTLEADSRVLWGNEGQTRTSDLSPVSFRYAVVPADSLIISNDEYGNVNPDYPAELQPRDRARITSQADIQKMANGIIPDVLADSPYVNNGAPIIRGDGVVVGGNGRVAALRLAESTGKSGEYEDYIRENAARFGIEGELPENPILVRVADTDDWRELARKSNESTNAAMSSTEQALADADALDADILSMLAVDDEGELNTPKNRDFIAAFVNQVAGDSERGSLVDADGYLSQQGLRRVQAAVFAKAYKDTGMLARMSESLDDDMKNVTKALMGAASRAAVFSENVASGDAYDIDVTNEILAGIEIFEQAKKDGTDIDDIAGQMSLEGQKYGDAARAVAQFINTNKRSGAKIRDFLSAIYDKVLSLGSPNQISLDMFGGTENNNVTVNEIFRSAARQLIDEAGYDLAGEPRINLGFEIESIGEQTSLPRNVRESEAESFNGNGDNTVRDVRQPESGRGRAPAQRGGRVTLPAAAEAPDSGRYIDRQSKDFNDIVRQEAEKLGMVTPPEGQLELDDEKERRRAIDNAAQTTREWADRQVESINAQRLAAQAQTESERQRILAEANEQGEARRRLGNKVAEETVSRAEEEADLYRQGARAEVSQWVEESQNAADNLYEARQRAKEAASERKNNADISVPKTDDAAGQKKMFSDNYNARRAYTLAKATARLSDADWERVADLMRGRLSPEYDIGDAEDPSGVQKVFYAMLDYDRTSRTVETYRTQKNGELRRQADRLLTNVSAFKDKKTGFQYSRETQERNIRDIAPKEDAEAIVAEMFRPVHHNTRLANDLIRKYTDRMKALNISQKTKDGNKVSEAYAIQLVGEMNAIINELSSANDRFQKTLQRKMDIYDSGMGTNGLTRQEADAMENMSRKQFHDYLMEKEPRKNGMSFSEASQALDEFMAANKNFDYGEINRKAKEIQKIYQELLPMLNETYMRWGYEPMGEIKGYFPHFLTSGDDLLRRLGKKLGVDQSAIGLPTEIAGQTQDFKPGVRWLANKLQRKSNITDYDVIEGFERYIRGAADVIYHTEDIQKLRQFANQIRYLSSDKGIQEQAKRIEQDGRLDPEAKFAALDRLYENARFALNNYVQNIDEYTNILAGKRSKLDRGFESLFGRGWVYGVTKALQGLRARSMVQGNITSALTNFIPIAQVSGLAGVRNTSRAFVDTLRNLTGKDGMRDMSDFLVNRQNIDPINLTKGQKIGKVAGALFELCDHIGSETAWRACYYRNLNSGMSKAAAAQLADEQAAGVVADRSKGALPTLFSAQNPIVKWATRFQLEQNNTLSYYFKDLPREKKEKALIGILISALASWLFNEGYEYLFGRRPAQEPLNLINELAGDLTGYELPNIYKLGEKMITEKRLPTAQDFETKQGDALKNAAVNAFDQMPFIDALNLVSKNLFGVELDGGRYGTTKYLPDFGKINTVMKDSDNTRDKAQVLVEELSAPVTNYLPGGNQIQKTVKGAATLAAGGSFKIDDKGERRLQYPVERNARNAATALIAGKSALPEAQEWIANDFNTFSAKDTAAIEGLQLMGVSMKDAVSLVDSVRNSGKSTADKLRALRDSDVSPEAKMLYYQSSLANDETTAMLDKYDGSADTGTLLNTLIDIQQCTRDADRSAVLERADLPDDLKEQMYTDLISSAKTRAKELQAVKDSGGTVNDFLSQKAENSTVNFDDGGKLTLPTAGEEQENQTSKTAKSLTGAGVSESGAEKIASAVDALDNPDNITQWKAVTSSGASEKDQLAAMEKYTSEDFYKKLTTASGQGVTVKKYVDWIDKRQDYDANGNGRYTMQEAADGLAAQRDMTKAEKAVLWQLTNNSWNPSKNPFDAGIGQAVYDVMHGAAASAPPSNGVLPTVQGNNALSQALSARSGG